MEFNSRSPKRSIFDRYFQFMMKRPISDRVILVITFSIFIIAALYTANLFNNSQKSLVPTGGGTLTEGIVGTPRFANPVLAITRADQDVAALVYSGLMKLSADGELVPDLAESITISEDGLVYNLILKENISFHDNVPLTTADFAYTIDLIQNPLIKSPLRGNWNAVTVEVIDEREVNLVLEEPYAPFIENLTVGILPKHVWSELSVEQLPFSQHNTEPIGSGPYKLDKVGYNKSGLINSYTLEAFSQGEQTAKISKIILRFYPNEDTLVRAFEEGEFLATAAFPQARLNEIDRDQYTIEENSLPRVFSVFLNQNKSAILRDSAVREALNVAVDREDLVDSVLFGFAEATDSPLPPGFLPAEDEANFSFATSSTNRIREAEAILIAGGWEQQGDGSWQKDIDEETTRLSITLTTANTTTFEKTATHLRDTWEKLGVDVNIALFEQSDLVQVIIRPRDYELLLFGTEIGRQLDLYPFWHSSQKDDPGLNISSYANITTDGLLETARTTQDISERNEALRQFETELSSEQPAIFLYSPTFTYLVRKDITTSPIEHIIKPSERFSQINSWYMSENNVWPIFAN